MSGDTTGSLQWVVAADDRRFDGHFPGDPMLPGACLLDQVIDALTGAGVLAAVTPRELAVAKFLAPVRPGDTVRLDWRRQAGTLHFECRVAAVRVASGSLR
ncbi:MAG TPA: 3-hydroxyacyl-ACP dehydratase [Burkholderiaceae bacterium]|nr:3-hydroxyacyl-ACP dehydratase [Burkholderiaceae bacterium]